MEDLIGIILGAAFIVGFLGLSKLLFFSGTVKLNDEADNTEQPQLDIKAQPKSREHTQKI